MALDFDAWGGAGWAEEDRLKFYRDIADRRLGRSASTALFLKDGSLATLLVSTLVFIEQQLEQTSHRQESAI